MQKHIPYWQNPTDKESKQSQYKIQIKSNKYPYDEKKQWKNKKIGLKNIQHSHKFHFKKHISKRLLFQKSNSKKKTENHIHVTKQFVIREHWGKKNPKSVSRKWKHASPPHQTPVNPLLRISLLGPSHQRLAPCISTTEIPLLHFICLIRNWETSKACF